MPPVAAAFETIGLAKVAKSAFEAKELGFLRATVQVTFNRERLLADAKQSALSLVEGYQPPEPVELVLPRPSGTASLAYALRDTHANCQAPGPGHAAGAAFAARVTGRAPQGEP